MSNGKKIYGTNGIGLSTSFHSKILQSSLFCLLIIFWIQTKRLLQNNNIRGNIPPEIGRLMKLKTLDLSNNNFTGQIPPTLSHSTSFQYLRLNNNSLTGTIPTSVANMTQLVLLDLSYNNLSGPVPRLHANAYNVIGNPQICSTGTEEDCNRNHPKPTSLTFTESSDGGTKNQKFAVQFGLSLACICLLIIALGFY